MALVQPEGPEPSSINVDLTVPPPTSQALAELQVYVYYRERGPESGLTLLGEGPLMEAMRCRSSPTPPDTDPVTYDSLNAASRTAVSVLAENDSLGPTDENGEEAEVAISEGDTPVEEREFVQVTDWVARPYGFTTVDEVQVPLLRAELTCQVSLDGLWQSEGSEYKLTIPWIAFVDRPNRDSDDPDYPGRFRSITALLTSDLRRTQANPEPESTTLLEASWSPDAAYIEIDGLSLEPEVQSSTGISAVFRSDLQERDRETEVFIAGVLLAAVVSGLIALAWPAFLLAWEGYYARKARRKPTTQSAERDEVPAAADSEPD